MDSIKLGRALLKARNVPGDVPISYGFDLVSCFNSRAYDVVAQTKGLSPLPDFGRRDGAWAVLLGTTKRFWSEIFIPWLRADPKKRVMDMAHPFDSCVTEQCDAMIKEICHGICQHDIIHSWDMTRLVAFQALADQCCGLAHLDETFHLCIHPQYGTWIGLRTVVVFDHAPPPPPPPETYPFIIVPRVINDDDMIAARAAFEKAQQTSFHDGIPQDWRKWVAIRDAISIGREYRYSEEEIRYHYCKDKLVLENCVWQQ